MSQRNNTHRSEQMEELTKVCTKCGVRQKLTDFHRRKETKDGRYSWCRKCKNAKRKEYEETYKKTERAKLTHKRSKEKMQELYPEKAKARQLAQNRRKRLKKENCETCGETNNLHLHHPDYSKPLEVATLCRNCHDNLHATMRSRSEL